MALQALLGAGPNVDGLPCTPGTGLAVNIGPGSVYVSAPIDQTAYGSLPADTTDMIVQQGIVFGETSLAVAAPTAAGQSIDYLVEVRFQQVDSDPVQLLYYDSDNPLQPLRGTATNTKRGGVCALQVKAGTPATTGMQVPPAPDAGWSGLYVVTVPYGATDITQGGIALYPGAPFIQTKLGNLFQVCPGNPNGVLAGNAGVAGTSVASMALDLAENAFWICTTTGTASTAVWSHNSLMRVYAGNPNGSVAGTAGTAGGPSPTMLWDATDNLLWVCTTTGGAASAVWSIVNGAGGTFPFWCGTSAGSANAQVITTPSAMQSFGSGAAVSFTVGFTNTGAVNLTVGSFGTFAVRKDGPTGPIPLASGELVAGNIVSARYNGTYLQLLDTAMGTAALANASSGTGVVAAVVGSGSITPGHLAVFSDSFGTVEDGGPVGIAPAPTYINAPATLGPGVYNIDTSAGAFAISLLQGAATGESWTFNDVTGTWSPNNFTVNLGSYTITPPNASTAQPGPLTCNVAGESVMVWFNGTTLRMF